MAAAVGVGPVSIGGGGPLALIGGPCAIEDEQFTVDMAVAIRDDLPRLDMPYVFKASYDKANRSSIDSFRGPGLTKGLEVLARVREEVGVPVVTDVHEAAHCCAGRRGRRPPADPRLPVPADRPAARGGRDGPTGDRQEGPVRVAAAEMSNAVRKLEEGGAAGVLLVERGTSFGYNNLVVDFRGIDAMRAARTPGGLRRDAQRPDARGARHALRRAAAVRPRARPRRGRGGRRRAVHGDPRRPGQRPQRRPEHGAAGPPGAAARGAAAAARRALGGPGRPASGDDDRAQGLASGRHARRPAVAAPGQGPDLRPARRLRPSQLRHDVAEPRRAGAAGRRRSHARLGRRRGVRRRAARRSAGTSCCHGTRTSTTPRPVDLEEL